MPPRLGASRSGPLYVLASGNNLTISPLWSTQGLVGYWPLNEGSGNSAADASGNGNTGSWSGTPAGNNGTYYTGGKVGSYAGDFDGSTDYVETGNANALAINSSLWTLSFWFMPSSSSGANTEFIVINGVITVNRFGVIWQGASSPLRIYNGSYYNSSQSAFTVGVWYFLTAVQGENILSLYINGLQDSSHTSGYTVTGVASPLSIGKFSSSYFPGLVDDVRVYNRDLSPAEILAIYNAEK